MRPYGQFCSIAKALEIVGERWSLLILRELICGSSRFNEIHRGVPRISPSLLTKRLGELEQAGLIRKSDRTGRYEITPAGAELRPLLETLGIWGRRWVRGRLGEDDLDPDVLMWDMRRRIDLDKMPEARVCIRFEYTDAPEKKSIYWLLGSKDGVELCVSDPGHDVDLYVTTDVRTMTEIWNGDLSLRTQIEAGAVDLVGSRRCVSAFPEWLQLNMFAGVAPARDAV